MPNVIGEAVVRIVADTLGLSSGLEGANSKLNAFSSGMQQAGRSISNIGQKMTIAGIAIEGALGLGAKAGIDFQQAMAESLAIMGDLPEQTVKDIEKAARGVAKVTKFSATEAAEAFYYLASAGFDAKSAIEALPKVAAFAQAGNFDMAMSTEYLADAQSALGLSIKNDAIKNMENLVRVSDVLIKANVMSNATTEQFAESLTNRAAAALRLLNKDVEEGVAVLATYADQGYKGMRAGEALSIVLRDLQRAAQKNKGTFKDLGISVYDSEGKMRNMADIVDDITGALSGLSDEQKRATLTSLGFMEETVSNVLMLVGNGDKIRTYEKALRSASGYTEDVAMKQMEGLGNQFKVLKNRILDVGIVILEAAKPALEKFFEIIDKAFTWFENLDPKIKTTIVGMVAGFGAMLVAAGPFLMVLGQIVTAVGGLVGGIAGAGGLAAAGEIILPIFAAIAGIAVVVAAALAGIVVTGIAVSKMMETNFGGFRDSVMEIYTVLKDNLVPIWEDMKKTALDAYNQLKAWFENNRPWIESLVAAIMNAVKGVTESVMPFLTRMYEWFRDKFKSGLDAVLTWWTTNGPIIEGAVKNIGIAMKWIIDNVWPYLEKYLKLMGSSLTGMLGNAFKFVGDLLMLLAALIGGDWDAALKKLKDMGWDLLGIIKATPVVKPWIEQFDTLTKIGAWERMGKWFEDLWDNIKKWFLNLGTTIGTWIFNSYIKPWLDAYAKVKEAVEKVKEIFATIKQKIINAVTGGESMADTVGEWINAIKSPFETMGEWFQGVWDKVTGIFETAVNSITGFFTRIAEAVLNNPVVQEIMWWVTTIYGIVDIGFAILFDKISQWINSAYNKIVEVWTMIHDWIVGKIQSISDTVSGKVDEMSSWWGEKWGIVRDAVIGVWDIISNWVSGKVQLVHDAIMSVVNKIVEWWQPKWAVVRDTVKGVWDEIYSWVSGKVQAVHDWIMSKVDAIMGWWSPKWEVIKSAVISVWDKIYTAVSTKIEAVRSWIETKVNAIKTKWEEIWGLIKTFITTLIGNVYTAVSNKVEEIRAKIVEKLQAALDWVKNTWATVKDAIVQPIIDAYNSAKEWVNDIKEKMEELDPRKRNSPSIIDLVSAGYKELAQVMSSLPRQVSVGLNYDPRSLTAAIAMNSPAISGGQQELHSHLYLDGKEIYEHIKTIGDFEDSRKY